MERTKRNDFSTFGAADHFTFDDALADRNTCMGTHEHDITRRIPQHWQPGHRATYANERLPRHSGQDVDGEPACQVVASNSLGSRYHGQARHYAQRQAQLVYVPKGFRLSHRLGPTRYEN